MDANERELRGRHHGFEKAADEEIAIGIFMFDCPKQFRFPW